MVTENKIWMAKSQLSGENLYLLPQMANRHGLIAGATGTGKTVTLKVMAESFSRMGVLPPFSPGGRKKAPYRIRQDTQQKVRCTRCIVSI